MLEFIEVADLILSVAVEFLSLWMFLYSVFLHQKSEPWEFYAFIALFSSIAVNA